MCSATYVGFYDTIRDLFTQAPLAVEREYRPGRFSFNVRGGRCEECQGEGSITTQLYFMPDVEVTCGACMIEHHLDVIKVADHVIDLGPGGGHAGGEVVAPGTPEVIARTRASHTGRFLKPHLARRA